MPYKGLSTSKIAKAAGCHPNTVRMYEEWGFLPPVPRSKSGYRLYTGFHQDQMVLARTAFLGAYPGIEIRRSVLALVRHAATGDLEGALALAHQHLSIVHSEIAHADSAAAALQRWTEDRHISEDNRQSQPLHIRDAARLVGITVDTLRSWERNGLLEVDRDPHNRYRLFGPAEIGRLQVIRMLRNAGYSPMAILRMLTWLDQEAFGPPDLGELKQVLDTPRPDEDVYMASDRLISTLKEHEQRAQDIIRMLEAMIQKHGLNPLAPAPASPQSTTLAR